VLFTPGISTGFGPPGTSLCVEIRSDLIPSSVNVGLSGTANFGMVGDPPPSSQGNVYQDPNWGYIKWKGWGRWFIYTWSVDANNCSGTINLTQAHAW